MPVHIGEPAVDAGVAASSWRQRDLAYDKIDGQNATAQKIESEQTVDEDAGRQSMAEHGEVCSVDAQCRQFADLDAWHEFHAAASSDLNVFSSQCRFVSNGNEQCRVDQRTCRPGVERQAQTRLSVRSLNVDSDDNKARRRIKRLAHTTISVPFGIVPIYMIANRAGRNVIASR